MTLEKALEMAKSESLDLVEVLLINLEFNFKLRMKGVFG